MLQTSDAGSVVGRFKLILYPLWCFGPDTMSATDMQMMHQHGAILYGVCHKCQAK